MCFTAGCPAAGREAIASLLTSSTGRQHNPTTAVRQVRCLGRERNGSGIDGMITGLRLGFGNDHAQK